MIDKIDQESEEYLKWKQGSVPVEELQQAIEPEQVVEELPEPKRSKIFFMDWFFGIKTHKGQMKMMYYSFTFFFYYLFCVASAYLLERRDTPEFDISEILYLFLLAIPVAIMLPFVLLFMGFTLSGGIFIGMFVGIFSWLFGIGAKFLYRIFGFDMDLLFPEFVGKKGEITKRSILGKRSAYPFTATISDMGLPGESLLYNNNFSVRSDDELKVGMEIEIIEHENRSITSWIKNHPTFLVREVGGKIILNKEKM
tara:strand:+ start:232 stop:993 length:762 start_codon:yes stop_codon:yes gene_type:complete